MKELQSQFGGAAEAAAKTEPWVGLFNAIGDVSEAIGGIIVQVLELDKTGGLTDIVADWANTLKENTPGIVAFIKTVATEIEFAFKQAWNVGKFLLDNFLAYFQTVARGVKLGADLIGFAIKKIRGQEVDPQEAAKTLEDAKKLISGEGLNFRGFGTLIDDIQRTDQQRIAELGKIEEEQLKRLNELQKRDIEEMKKVAEGRKRDRQKEDGKKSALGGLVAAAVKGSAAAFAIGLGRSNTDMAVKKTERNTSTTARNTQEMVDNGIEIRGLKVVGAFG